MAGNSSVSNRLAGTIQTQFVAQGENGKLLLLQLYTGLLAGAAAGIERVNLWYLLANRN